MSEQLEQQPRSDRALTAVLVTVLHLSLVIASWGVTSLVLDADVIAERDAGPLLGPSIAAASVVVTWLSSWLGRGGVGLRALSALVSSWAAMLVVGAIGYTATRGELAWLWLFPARYALSPFVVAAAVVSAGAVAAAALMEQYGRQRR